MRYPIKDCQCEDFPCCEHADNYPVEDPMDLYCDMCGACHAGPCEEEEYDGEDESWEEWAEADEHEHPSYDLVTDWG